jgi:hypothetical protein
MPGLRTVVRAALEFLLDVRRASRSRRGRRLIALIVR